MSDIYEKNMEALGKKMPTIKEYLEFRFSTDDKDSIDKRAGLFDSDIANTEYKGPNEEIEVIKESAYDGTTIFRVKKDEYDVYLSGKRDPACLAKVWTKNLKKLPRSSYVILFGIGNGDFLKEVITATKDEINILVYEPSLVILRTCLETVDLSEQFEKRHIELLTDICGSTEKLRGFLAVRIAYESLEFMRHFTLPNYAMLYPKEFKWFWEQMKDVAYKEQVQYSTQELFSRYMVTNMLVNSKHLPDCYTSVQLVGNVPREIPAIVVAAGPSLDKNIEKLKRAKNKAFIIAVDTAARPLHNHGIKPDMVAVIDCVKPAEAIVNEDLRDIPLLCSIVCSPEIMDYQKGKKFFFSESYDYVEKIFRDNNVDFRDVHTGGSVSTTAFSLMYMIGIDNIILVGQDLAFSGDQAHASGSFEILKDARKGTKDIEVEGNYEEKVYTGADFKIYLDWYKSFLQGAKLLRPNLRVINATEGGAKIEFTEVMTLDEAIDELCTKEYDVDSMLANIPPAFNKEQRRNVVKYLRDTEVGFRTIGEEAERCKKYYRKIDNMVSTGNISPKEYIQLLNKIKKSTKKIRNNWHLYQCIDSTLVHANMIMLKENLLEEESILEEAKEISRKGMLYMDLVKQCADLFAQISADTVSQVKDEKDD